MYTFLIGDKAGVGFIPRFVKAKTAKGLELQMLKTQMLHRAALDWKTIFVNPSDGLFYAYYMINVDLDDAKKDEQKIKEADVG